MKYHAESPKVSIVSVSRRASRPQRGQSTLKNARQWFSGLPLPSGTRSSGSPTGRAGFGTRYRAAVVAVNDRDRRAPVALARNAPVAQTVLHLLESKPARLQVGCDR